MGIVDHCRTASLIFNSGGPSTVLVKRFDVCSLVV